MRKVAFWLLVGLTAGSAACAPRDGKPLSVSVCDILKNPWRYRGELVTVHGLVMETIEGTYLWEWNDQTNTCRLELANQGKQWPLDLNVYWSDSADVRIRPGLSEMRARLKQEENAGKVAGYTARITGKVHTRVWTRIRYINAGIGYRGNGFGQNGACAAAIEAEGIVPGQIVYGQDIERAYPRKSKE